MSAKKTGKTQTPTPAPSKKRARFPRTEAALAGRPLTGGPAEPTTESTPVEGMAEMTTPEPGQAEPPPEPVAEGPAADAVMTDDAVPGAAAPTEGTLPEPAADGVAGPPAAQATTEPPIVAGPGAEATAEGQTPDADPAEHAGAAPEAPGKGKKGRKPRAAKAKAGEGDGTVKKLSALDAAARVLGEAGRPMGCKELIAAMVAKGYWASPAGRTPEATLYSAILRELTTKGAQGRFVKAQRGQFALKDAN